MNEQDEIMEDAAWQDDQVMADAGEALTPIDPATMTHRELQKACKGRELLAVGTKEELRLRLEEYLADPEAAIAVINARKEAEKRAKEEKKKLMVDWRNHPAREILLNDLEPGGWLYGIEEDAKLVCDTYKSTHEEFEKVPFDQFEARHKGHMRRAAERRARSALEAEWLKHDRLLHPRQTHNARGEPVFDMDIEAKEQLRDDIKEELFKQMEPKELWRYRDVYKKYKLRIFRPRTHQEIRRQKMPRYPDWKRTKKQRAHAKEKAKQQEELRTAEGEGDN